MRKIASFAVFCAALVLAGCGGGGSSDAFTPAPTPGSGATVGSVSLTTSKASILSDGSETADIKVFVRDASNVLLKGVAVSVSANNNGSLQVPTPATTADDGTLTVVLSSQNATPRTITVTATAGGVTGTVNVDVRASVTVGSLTLSTSTPTIPSNGSLPATITALIRDNRNGFMANVPVTFSTSSGGITPSATTNAGGAATATLTAVPDPTNRNITVTATAQGVTQQLTLAVTGSRLSIQGANALVLGANAAYTVTLLDSGDVGIVGRAIAVSSARGNTLSASALTTDSTGKATFSMTISNPGNDTITISGLGLTATQTVTVNADAFTFSTPTLNAEIPLNTPTSVTVHWLSNGAAVVGQPVTITSTRGTVTGSPALTNASGDATVTVSSTSAGGALLTASASGTATAQRLVEYVATTVASVDVQPNVFTVAPNEQATLTAVVRDAAGNLVKNQTVSFSLNDTTGGTLSVASAITNSQGRAQTFYTAGSTTSARDGVKITAAVGAVSKEVSLTVARKEVFISLGTGNTISEPNEAQYKIQFTVQVTDSNGNGVAGRPLTMSVLSQRYIKGTRVYLGTWANYAVPSYICGDEDTNRNGQLDPGEDFNLSGRIEAGNIALVTPSSVVTNDQGFALVDVLYPQDFAYWLEVSIEARTSVQGTEFVRTSTFLLPGSTNDFGTDKVAPPGVTSPFGVNACGVAN